MRTLFSGIVGVIATVLFTGGLGMTCVTLISRMRNKRVEPMKWAHLLLGLSITTIGLLLIGFSTTVNN